MRHVYFVVPDLSYAGHAKQVSLLAPGVVRAGWTAGVYSLAGAGPFGDPLRAAGMSVERQSGSASRDLRSWAVLRWMIPAPGRGVVHAFGLRVLRRLMTATAGSGRPRIVLSLTGRERLTWLDRRLLRPIARVIVPRADATDALTRQGVSAAQIIQVPPAVAEAPSPPDRDAFLRVHDLPPDAKLIITAGRMDTRLRLFDALWAFEILRYGDSTCHLLLVGDGPGRTGMESAAAGLAPEGTRARFLGARSDVPSLLGLADVVHIPNRAGGVNVALEAMAASRTVIAADSPDLSAIISDGVTGFLVRPGDHTATAKLLWRLLRDPAERARVGAAAARAACERHHIDTLVPMMEAVYGE
jgi:glycosyltransferase involved in cell wall biosynthesis